MSDKPSGGVWKTPDKDELTDEDVQNLLSAVLGREVDIDDTDDD